MTNTLEATWLCANGTQGSAYPPLEVLNQWWKSIKPRYTLPTTSLDVLKNWQTTLRDAVELQLGWTPPAIPLTSRTLASGSLEDGVNYRYGEVETTPGVTVPFMLLLPATCTVPTPGILCLHGHGDGMNPLFGYDANGQPISDEYQHAFALEACKRGFVALTFDMLAFGRRRDFDYCQTHNAYPCESPSKIALQLGSSMLALRVFDARQMLTLLAQQHEVAANRLGAVGISGGGTVAFFTSVLDARVRAATISGFYNKFSAYMQVPHCIDNFVPGMATLAEMPDIGCVIAPRPLLISQGERDPIFPIVATRAAVTHLRQAYHLYGAEEKIEEEYFNAEHSFSHARVWDFMTKWL